jgi:hypothetical protein
LKTGALQLEAQGKNVQARKILPDERSADFTETANHRTRRRAIAGELSPLFAAVARQIAVSPLFAALSNMGWGGGELFF